MARHEAIFFGPDDAGRTHVVMPVSTLRAMLRHSIKTGEYEPGSWRRAIEAPEASSALRFTLVTDDDGLITDVHAYPRDDRVPDNAAFLQWLSAMGMYRRLIDAGIRVSEAQEGDATGVLRT